LAKVFGPAVVGRSMAFRKESGISGRACTRQLISQVPKGKAGEGSQNLFSPCHEGPACNDAIGRVADVMPPPSRKSLYGLDEFVFSPNARGTRNVPPLMAGSGLGGGDWTGENGGTRSRSRRITMLPGERAGVWGRPGVRIREGGTFGRGKNCAKVTMSANPSSSGTSSGSGSDITYARPSSSLGAVRFVTHISFFSSFTLFSSTILHLSHFRLLFFIRPLPLPLSPFCLNSGFLVVLLFA